MTYAVTVAPFGSSVGRHSDWCSGLGVLRHANSLPLWVMGVETAKMAVALMIIGVLLRYM